MHPTGRHVVLHFSVEAYSGSNKEKVALQEFYLERPTQQPMRQVQLSGFADLTRQAADRIQAWLAGLPDK